MRLKNFSSVSFIFLIGIFLMVARLVYAEEGGNPQNPLKFNNVGELINGIADFIILVALPIATIMVVYGAFLFLTAGGGEDKVKKAKTVITLAIVGIAILLVAKGAALVIKDVLGVNSSGETSSILLRS